jgi:cellulose 1,4-beta-cellobiosidase
MPNHAIIDTGRNAVQKLRAEWGNWCNVKGAGFGVRPTADTGTELADAFVWVKVSILPKYTPKTMNGLN